MSEWKGCTRSHPHEDMSEECEFKTVSARTINSLANELAATKQKLLAEQLHIKELRAASTALVERWDTPLWKDVPHTAEYIHRLRDALAKQPDTRALDKALLEARIDELIYAAKQCGMVSERVEHYKAKLAELNKE